jgi:hypothetical protein
MQKRGPLLLCTLLLTLAFFSGNRPPQPFHSRLAPVKANPSAKAGRLVYPLSVVPGGVHSPEEAANTVARDAQVARHYQSLHLRRLRYAITTRPLQRYVSFRKHNKIFWTRRPITVPAREEVLVDDRGAMLRTRCGNRLSTKAGEPVLTTSEQDPTAAELDTPINNTPLPLLLAATETPDEAISASPALRVPPPGDGENEALARRPMFAARTQDGSVPASASVWGLAPSDLIGATSNNPPPSGSVIAPSALTLNDEPSTSASTIASSSYVSPEITSEAVLPIARWPDFTSWQGVTNCALGCDVRVPAPADLIFLSDPGNDIPENIRSEEISARPKVLPHNDPLAEIPEPNPQISVIMVLLALGGGYYCKNARRGAG